MIKSAAIGRVKCSEICKKKISYKDDKWHNKDYDWTVKMLWKKKKKSLKKTDED